MRDKANTAEALEGSWGKQILAGAVSPTNQHHDGLSWLQGLAWAPNETLWGVLLCG